MACWQSNLYYPVRHLLCPCLLCLYQISIASQLSNKGASRVAVPSRFAIAATRLLSVTTWVFPTVHFHYYRHRSQTYQDVLPNFSFYTMHHRTVFIYDFKSDADPPRPFSHILPTVAVSLHSLQYFTFEISAILLALRILYSLQMGRNIIFFT